MRVIRVGQRRAAAVAQPAVVSEQRDAIAFVQQGCAARDGHTHVGLALELRRGAAIDNQHRLTCGGIAGQDEVEVLEVVDTAYRQPLVFYGKRVARGGIVAAIDAAAKAAFQRHGVARGGAAGGITAVDGALHRAAGINHRVAAGVARVRIAAVEIPGKRVAAGGVLHQRARAHFNAVAAHRARSRAPAEGGSGLGVGVEGQRVVGGALAAAFLPAARAIAV